MILSTYKNLASLTSASVVFVGLLILPQFALAFFSDTEESNGQKFVAGELLLDAAFDNQELYVGPGLTTEHEFVLPVTFSSSSIESRYDIVVTETSGHEVFCGALALETARGSESSAGYFETFASAAYSAAGEVVMTVSYDANERAIPHNASCTAQVVLEAWQANMPKATAGYRDRATFSITVTAHMVVLNEVLARPNTIDTQVPNVEFIELYNNSDFALDVLGFNITELTAGGLPTNHFIANVAAAPASALVAYNGSLSTIVPAHGHLALKYRGLPSYLNDNGDTITLFDTGTGAAIDSYRYTTALVGKSDARIPDGVGAWVDPIPTPNEENIAEDFLLATTPATTTVFTDLAESATSTEPELEEVAVATPTASSTPEAVPEVEVIEEAVEPIEVVEEEEVEEVAVVAGEEPAPASEPLPLTDTNSGASALLDPEPAAKTSEEEEVKVEEEPVAAPPEI